MRENLITKYADRFGKVRRHLEDVKRTNKVALWLSQISGTIGCMQVMRDEKGVVFLPRISSVLKPI